MYLTLGSPDDKTLTPIIYIYINLVYNDKLITVYNTRFCVLLKCQVNSNPRCCTDIIAINVTLTYLYTYNHTKV